MYNYADDNTWSKSDKTLGKVISALEEDSNSLINWFSANKMQANPEKFQAISVGRKTHDKNDICKKAARQLNVLKRIGKHLNRLGKLTIYYIHSLCQILAIVL